MGVGEPVKTMYSPGSSAFVFDQGNTDSAIALLMIASRLAVFAPVPEPIILAV
jgi:hypothetical protein